MIIKVAIARSYRNPIKNNPVNCPRVMSADLVINNKPIRVMAERIIYKPIITQIMENLLRNILLYM
jgi:hypothetical protein